MGYFGVAFTGESAPDDPLVAIGTITLGETHEHFRSILTFWSVDDYEKSWSAGLMRLLAGAEVSCLATSVTDPAVSDIMEVWPLYRSGTDIYVQDHLIFLDQLSHEFDPAAPWDSVRPRETVSEDGREVSEWRVSLDDVRAFLESDRSAPPER